MNRRDRLYACPKSAVGFCKVFGNLTTCKNLYYRKNHMKISFSDIERKENQNRDRIMRQVEELRYEVFSLIESSIVELNNNLPSLAKRPIKLSTSNNNVFHAIPKNECYEIEIGYKGMMELLSYAELIADELYEITKIEFNKHSEAFFQIWLMAIIFHEISHILRGHND